jgi:hypothetical protein
LFVFGDSITNTAGTSFACRVTTGVETELLDVDRVAYASIEDGQLFLIHDAGLEDSHGLIAPVIELARRAGLVVDRDRVCDSSQYLSGEERARWFSPA